MKKFFSNSLCAFTLLCILTTTAHAQRYNYQSYPRTANLFGIMGGLSLTSNPEMMGYDVKKNYVDGGGGFVYIHKNDVSENYTYEIISSLMLSSCSTSRTESGEDKLKVILPLEGRWSYGSKKVRGYCTAGCQYNFIWSLKSVESDGYYYYDPYYDPYYGPQSDVDMSAGAHQLSGNVGAGMYFLGAEHLHILVGAKYHFPIINNAEGIEYSDNDRIDFSKDKSCLLATASLSYDLGNSGCVIMLNYDLPLGGGNKETEIKGSFFEMNSQSVFLSLLWSL